MHLVSAWSCKYTNKVFLDKDEYITYLKKLAKKRLINFKIKKAQEMRFNLFEEMRRLDSFNKIEEWIVRESELFVFAQDSLMQPFKDSKIPRIAEISFMNMKFSNLIVNTHAAPFGKLTNWHRDASLPIGYMGWRGHISIMIFGKFQGSLTVTDLFKDTGIYLGTGSGYSKFDGKRGAVVHVYNSDIILFADDWPGLKEQQILIRLASD